MSIILTTQPNLSDDKTLNMLGDFGDAIGIPGLPQPNKDRGSQTAFGALQSDLNSVIDKLTGRSNQEQFDADYVGDGKQRIPGGVIQGGKVPALEEASIRQIYSQTPQISVIIKKRAFSGLQHLYDPSLMDSAEKWLLRSIKRLTAAKCQAMALYERLTKIKRLEDIGANPGLILASLVATISEESGQTNAFTSAMQLQRAQANRQPPDVTTYYIDESFPIIEELGPGNGIFEITAISTLNTNLNLNGSGSCSFEVEDPYRILIVDETDIEMAIRETALSRFVDAVSSAAGLSLTSSQAADSNLQKSRQSNNKSAITFSVGVGSNSGVSAMIDAIGFEITENNLNDVPEPHELSAGEQTLFKLVMTNLKNYEFAMRKNTLQGLGGLNSSKIKEEVKYTREKLRLYHMGKSIIQPMDSVHVLIDGGTRKLGETGDIEDPNEKFNFKTVTGSLNVAGSILGLQNGNQVDDELLEIEWRKEGQHMLFRDFKTLRTLQGSGEGGIHVFGGLVKTVTDKFDAGSGKFVLSVSCDSNMEWLKISRFNTSPSLAQIEGIIYDPLTPFKIDVDQATGLPSNSVELLDENTQILSGGLDAPKIYFDMGEKTGIQALNESTMSQDVRQVGGNIITLYQHAPGLVYRWKPGIMTASYNMSTTDPKDGSAVTYKQLRREVGYFSSNTAFDNMDSANIISILVTGSPYDPVRFVQAAMQTGAFSKDTTYNDYRQFFHTFLDVQRTMNVVQGGFMPFKLLQISPADLAKNLCIQRQLLQKSSRLQQVRTQSATLTDKLNNLEKAVDPRIKNALAGKISDLTKQEETLTNEIMGFEGEGEFLKGSKLYIAGNDITFELAGGHSNVKLFGDRLRHAALRRREDIVRGKDSNYLIISDEYDKDYDIQAFILKLQSQTSEMWAGKWETPYAICSQVAEILNFEFYVDTQGHLVFRPPQYNRTPASVLNNLFSMEKSTGIGIIPDFLKKLFLSREESLINDIIILQLEIILNGALLGFTSVIDIQREIDSDEFFINEQGSPYKIDATKRNVAVSPTEKARLKTIVDKATVAYQLNAPATGGVFNAVSQARLQKNVQNNKKEKQGSDTLYNSARKELIKRRGGTPSSIPEYDKAKVGVTRNGQSNKSSDIARIVSNIADLVSRKSKLLLSLGKVLEQTVQIASLDSGGDLSFSPQGLIDTNYRQNSALYNYLIEDDTKNVLGHMSGERFIIRDETIISATFEEKPPEITTVQVNGTEPIVGDKDGNLAGIPVYAAYGADFDLWRQYGWRGEKAYEKPFFWSAELQCAPYAVMLLSRQRKNIVTGEVTLMGNEYYQLGDVVYITHRNMLYYVDSIQHSISYNGQFSTKLTLKYGHTPGEYIPTPLDVIGKGLVEKGRVSSAYRMRRDIPPSDNVEGVIRFKAGSIDPLSGADANRNFEELKRAALAAKQDRDQDPTKSSKIFIVSFGGDKNTQDSRANAIRSWFNSPYYPNEPKNGIGGDGIGGDLISNTSNSVDKEISDYQINDSYLKITHVKQTEDYKNLRPSEKELLRSGLVATQKTISIDRTLKNVIELRLRQPPKNGWSK
jgi:hypothetical protein